VFWPLRSTEGVAPFACYCVAKCLQQRRWRFPSGNENPLPRRSRQHVVTKSCFSRYRWLSTRTKKKPCSDNGASMRPPTGSGSCNFWNRDRTCILEPRLSGERRVIVGVEERAMKTVSRPECHLKPVLNRVQVPVDVIGGDADFFTHVRTCIDCRVGAIGVVVSVHRW